MRKLRLFTVIVGLLGMMSMRVEAQSCATVSNLSLRTGTTSVYATWSTQTGGTPSHYKVYVDGMNGTNVQTATVYAEHALVGGLDSNTQYRIRVQAECGSDTGRSARTTFRTAALPCGEPDTAAGIAGTYLVGSDGTSTTANNPIYQGYNYSYVMHWIAPSSMSLTGPAVINGIDFKYAYTQPMTHATNCSIYMGYSSVATNASGFVPFDSLTMVYEGPMNGQTQGWVHFAFNRGIFNYNGTRNVVVAIVNNSGSYDGSSYVWYYSSVSSTTRRYSSSSALTPAALRSLSATAGGTSSYRSNMRFTTAYCLRAAECTEPMLVVNEISDDSATIEWAAGWRETQWDLEMKAEGASSWTTLSSATAAHSYRVGGLQPNTAYNVRLKARCTDTTISTQTTFRTRCTAVSHSELPVSYGFEDMQSAGTVPCWKTGSNSTSYIPSASTTSPHSGSLNLYLTSYGQQWGYVVSPRLEDTLSRLQVTFYGRRSSTSYTGRFVVGTMSNPDDASTFHALSTLTHPSGTQWEYFEADLTGAPASDHYVAIHLYGSSGSTNYGYLDDIRVRTIPNCRRVTNLRASNITSSSVNLDWVDSNQAGIYLIEHGASGFAQGTGSWVTAYDTTYTLTGLTPGTLTDIYVYSLCQGDTSSGYRISVRTQCGTISRSNLPYRYGFEDATGGGSSYSISPCYRRGTNNTSTTYPYPSSSYRASGTYSMYFYGSASYYCYLAMPSIENGVNDLMVSFDLMSTSTSYRDFEVGVMTDSSDYSTFTRVATFAPASPNVFETYVVTLDSYSGSGDYIAFRIPMGTQANYFYLDNIMVSEMPACSPARALTVESVTGTSAMVRWSRMGSLPRPSYYELEIEEAGSAGTVSETDTIERHLFGGLTPHTTYTVRVRGVCDDGTYTYWESTRLTTGCLSGGDSRPTGTDGTQYSGVPVCSGYGNSFSQSIYTATELHNLGLSAGNITGCTFTWSTNSSYAKRFHIYLDTTWRSSYPSSSYNYYDPIDLAHRYYSGTHALNTSGTVDYRFTRPFQWDGVSNIVVTTIMNQPPGASHSSSNFYGNSTAGPSNSTMFYYRDGTAFDTTSRAGGVNGLVSNRPDIVFRMPCDSTATCVTPTAYVVSNYATEATVAWVPGYQESTWSVEYRTGTTGPWIMEDQYCSSTDYTFNWLSPNTRYQVRITPDCQGGGSMHAALLDFTTPCQEHSLPFIDNFDNWNSTTGLPACWHRINNYSGSTYPYLSTSYRHSGNYSAYMNHYGSSSYYSGYVLPLLTAQQVSSLMVDFWLYKENTSYANNLQVGVMTDPDNFSTFTPVATVSPTTSGVWEEFSVSLAGYSGTGRYIALVAPMGNYYNYVYMDDLYVDYTPNCTRPDSLTVSNVSTNSADVAWSYDAAATEWVLEYGPQGFQLGTGTMVSATQNNTTLTGLGASMTYDLYVAAICNYSDTSWYVSTSFQTECGAISRSALPYRYGFDDATGSGSQQTINRCFVKGTNYSTPYPYPSSSYHSNGSYSLYFYGSSSYYCYLAMPSIENGVRDLMVSFDLLTNSTSYRDFEVGVMTDSSNYSTFTRVASFTPSTTYQFENFVTTLSGYTGQGAFIAFRVPATQTNYFYLDNIVVSELPACSPIRNLRADWTTGTAAMVTWSRIGGIPLASYYELEIEEAGVSGTMTLTDTADRHLFGSLNPLTTYTVRVRGVCYDGSYTDWESTTFTTGCLSGGDSDPSGTQTNTANCPVYYSSGNTFCQTIYTASQLRSMGLTAGDITGCTMQWSSNSSYAKRLHIYLDTTWRSSFPGASSSYWHRIDTAHRNYCGAHPIGTSGTVSYRFYRPFHWDGRSNLVLTTIMNQPPGSSHSYSYFYGYSTSTPDYMSMYYYRSSTAFDTNSVPTSASSRQQYQANVSFLMPCDSTVTCLAPTAYIANCAATQATVAWAPGYQESSWSVEYRMGNAGRWIMENPYCTDNDYTFTQLTPNTHYQVRLTPDCAASPDSMSTIIDINTPCMAQPLPFMENFDTWGSTTALPACWNRINNYTSSTYPYLSTSYRRSGNYAAYMNHYSSSSYYAGYVLPPLDVPYVDTLMVDFWLYKSNTSYANTLTVGVMTDPTDYSTFTAVATVTPSTSGVWEEFAVSLSSYSGTGRYIALLAPSGSTYNYVYLDDLYVDYIPNCGRPDSLTVSNVTATTADVAWNYDAAATEWVIEYGPQGFQLGTGTRISSLNNNYMLTGLGASMTYDLYLAAICNYSDTSWYINTSFQTQCGDISRSSMPWRYGFEDATGSGSSYSIHRCCYKNTNYSTSYPYPSSSYYASGSYSLYFYSYSSYYSYFVLPAVEDSVNDLMVEFKSLITSTSYSGFEVGVMGDPTDYSTFTPIASATPTTSSVWQRFAVSLAGYTDTGRYIAFRAAPGSSSYYFYLDDITVNLLPACSPISNINVSNITGTSARVSWSMLSGFAAPSSYDIEVVDLATGTTLSEMDTINWHVVALLTPMTQYKVRVRGMCVDGSYTDWDSTTFTTSCLSGGWSTPSGTGNSQTSGCPVYSGYGNTFCQSIYTAAELRSMGLSAGDLQGCTFSWTTNSSYNKRFHIFIDTTWRSSFPSASASYWHPISTSRRNYCGSHPIGTTGTVTYYFQRPFYWDGQSNIIVTAIMNQAPGSSQSSSGFMGISSSTSNYTTMYTYRDGTAYDTNSVPTSASSRLTIHPNISFMMPCDTSTTCVPPSAYMGPVGDNGATVCWAPGYQESSWRVDYRPQSSGTWLNATMNTTSTSYNLTGLQPNTRYEVRITPDCAVSPDSVSAMITFRTSCTPASLPFSENFDSWNTSSTASLPGCWFRLYNTSSPYPYATTSYNHTAGATSGKALYAYNTNSTSGYAAIVLPVLNAPTNQLELTFWAYKDNTSYSHKLRVGVVDDPEDFSTFTPVGNDLQISAVSTWEAFTVPLTSYGGLGRNIAIVSTYGYPYIDDIRITRISNCTRPTNCRTIRVNTNDATMGWDGHGVGTYIVEYGPGGFTQGQGTSVVVNDDSITLYGLTSNTVYDFYVRALCNSWDSSNWTPVETFRTNCDPITTLPYTYGFEDATTSGQNGRINSCWHKGTNYATTPYPYPYSSYVHSGSYSLYAYTTSTNYCYAVLPAFQASINDLKVSFWYRRLSSSYPGIVEVGVMTNPDDISTFTRVQTCTAAPGTAWEIAEVVFTRFNGSGRYIALRMPTNQTSGYLCIDDVTVDSAGSCPPPTQLASNAMMSTTTSAQVSWTENGYATSWIIEYGPRGFTLGQGTAVVTTNNPTTLSGLSPSADYEFVVRALCGGGDTSAYSASRGTFRTNCGVIPHSALPYTYGFEDAEGSGSSYSINRCWGGGTNSSTHYPYPYSSYVHSGTYSCYLYAYSSGNYYTYAVLPEFADAINTLTLSLWARKTSTSSSYTGYLIVGVVTDPNNINSLVPYDTLNFNTTTFSFDSVNFEDYNGPRGRICLYAKNFSGTYNSLYIDDVTVYICCATPTVTHTPTHDKITLTWGGRGNNYELAIKEDSETDWRPSVFTTGHTYTFTGLTQQTRYRYRVRQICDSTNQSGWFEGQVTTRQTPCLVPSRLRVRSLTNRSVSVYWTIGGYESDWVLRTWNATENRYDTVHTNPATITGLRENTTYNMMVAGLCSSTRTSGWSDTMTFTTLLCEKPTNLTASMSGIRATLSWTSPSGVNAWEVEYGPSGFTPGTGFITTVNSNPVTIAGLNPNQSYEFYVRTLCGNDFYSDWSSPASGTTGSLSSTDCNMPVNLQVSVSGTNATVSWTRGANNNGHWIVEYGPQGFQRGRGLTYTTTQPRTTLHNLEYNTTYDVYVQSDCGSNNLSPWAAPITFTVTCKGITSLTQQAIGTTAFLTWDYVAEATFEVEYGPRGFSRGTGTDTITTTNGIVIGGLTPNSQYTAYVRTLCDTSTHSNWKSVDFQTGNAGVFVCDPVSDFSATRVNNSAVVAWAPGNNNTGIWELEYGTPGFQHGRGTTISGINRPIIQIDNLSMDRDYQFYVRANCSGGNNSPWSPPSILHELSLGVSTVTLDKLSFIIFPNPTSHSHNATISITNKGDIEQIDIMVLDMTGRTMWRHRTLCPGSCNEQVPVSGLSSGTYFVRIATSQGASTQKLIVR